MRVLAGLGLELQAVGPDVNHPVDVNHPPRVLARPAADAGDERVPLRESLNLGTRFRRHIRLFGTRTDRCQDAVDVEQDGCAIGLRREGGEDGFGLHGSYDREVRLVLIGVAAGFFSALFGVGGGIVVVPLLILLAGFDPKPATGTSLAAIGLIALAGVAVYGFLDEVRPAHAALLGVPAALGAVVGARLQHRLGDRMLAYTFAALLAGVGITLLI